MGLSAVFDLLGSVLEILALVVLVRVLISWIPGIDPDNPFIRVIRAIADPIIAPFRGLLPSFGGMLDLSPILAIVVLEVAAEVLFSVGSSVAADVPVAYFLVAALEQIVETLVVIVIMLVLLRFVVALFHADPWHPLTRGIRSLARPFCRPFDGLTTQPTGFDAAALVALVVYVAVFVAIQIVFSQVVLPTVA
jgi:YggT family protein